MDDEPIRAWERDGILFERHEYAPGPAGELPRHAHADYRGARNAVPVGSLTILHPGEAHVVRDPGDRDVAATYLMMYVEPESIPGLPFFPDPVLLDAGLVRLFVAMHAAEEVGVPPHRYQLDLRIDRAKLLLARGEPIAGVAAAVGLPTRRT